MAKFTPYEIEKLKTAFREAKQMFNFILKDPILSKPSAKILNTPGNVNKVYDALMTIVDTQSFYKGYTETMSNVFDQYNKDTTLSERKPKPISARKPAPKKKTLSAKGYKRPAFDLETSGTYIFKTPKKDYIVKSYLFERENDIEDSLQIQNELRAELGAIIIKNSAWRNLANGKTIQARASKGQKGKLTKLK